MTIYDDIIDTAPRRKNNLTETDLLKIKEIFDEAHPCTSFTDDQLHTIKEAVDLLTPENIQAFKDILAIFRDSKKTVAGAIKSSIIVLIFFIFWLAYKTGFIGEKVLNITK